MTSTIDYTPAADRPRVEVVEEIPSPEAAARRAYVAGAIASGLVCAVIGVAIGFTLGVQSSSSRRAREED